MKKGFLNCEFPDNISESVQEKVQLLLEAMLISLQTIEEQYGKIYKNNLQKVGGGINVIRLDLQFFASKKGVGSTRNGRDSI